MIRVFVWNYGGFWKSIAGGTYNVGHAAVGIDTSTANKSIYLSWWPGGEDRKKVSIGNNSVADPHLDVLQDLKSEGTKKRKGSKAFAAFIKAVGKASTKEGLSPNEKQVISSVHTLLNTGELQTFAQQRRQMAEEAMDQLMLGAQNMDIDVFNRKYTEQERQYNYYHKIVQSGAEVILRPPDSTCQIPVLGESPLGLDVCRILRWWEDFAFGDQRSRYIFLEQNCSDIAALALKKSGAVLLSGENPTPAIWDPDKVKDFAQKTLVGYARKKQHFDTFVNLMVKNKYSSMTSPIMSYKAWKNASAGKKWAHRYKELKAIDGYLKKYQAIQNNQDMLMLGPKILYLSMIIVFCGDILTQRSRSTRKAAILTLGAQCYSRLQHLLMQYANEAARVIRVHYALFYEPYV